MAAKTAKAVKASWGGAIAAAAMLGLAQKIGGIPTAPMFCLKFTRLCIEHALNLTPGGMYRLVLGVDGNPTARELEKLLRAQKPAWLVPSVAHVQNGDTVWWRDLPPEFGHVGIVVWFKGAWWVAQNTVESFKGIDFPGALRLVKLSDMPTPSSIIRFGG